MPFSVILKAADKKAGIAMKIDVKENDDLVLIRVKGDIEVMSVKTFKQMMFEIGHNTDKDIEIDLSDVNYIDSSGIGVLISLLKLQKKKGKDLRMGKVSSKVLNVLKLSSLADVFDL